MKGIVIKSTGSWYHLLTEDGATYQARIRGKFRIANIKHTNPIAVGDEVEFEIDLLVVEEHSLAVEEVDNIAEVVDSNYLGNID